MSNLWNIPNIPHKGWILQYVYDVRANCETIEETEYKTCMMCNNERIRYVHVVYHQDSSEELEVGCICAEKMTNDYVTPKRREKELRNKANRKRNFISHQWKLSKNGNLFTKKDGHHLLIFKDRKSKKYKCKIDSHFGMKSFESVLEAKKAIFNEIEYYKKKNK